MASSKKRCLSENGWILLISFGIITLFSKCSFLYPVNDWNDTNAIFTVGKSILRGYVPYRDLFDHKGPLVYFIHSLGATISFNSFLGLFFLEVISCFAFLKIVLRTTQLFHSPRFPYVSLVIIGTIAYSSYCFMKGGSVEEFSLPFLALSLFLFLKHSKKGSIPTNASSFYIGICIGIIFWMKYNILGFYVGIIPVMFFFLLRDRAYVDAMRCCFIMLLGFIAISTIPIAYYVINGAIKDLFDVYFIDNIFHYHSSPTSRSILSHLLSSTGRFIFENFLLSACILTGLFSLRQMDLRGRLFLIISGLSMFVFTFFSVAYAYYSFIFCAFLFIGFIQVDKLLQKLNSVTHVYSIAVCLFAICICLNTNIYSLATRQDRWLISMKDVINDDNPSILCYKTLDVGLSTLTGSIPSVKFFYRPNTNVEAINEIQDNYIKDRRVDYVITSSPLIPETNGFVLITEKEYHPSLPPLIRLCDRLSGTTVHGFEDYRFSKSFFLYKNEDLLTVLE